MEVIKRIHAPALAGIVRDDTHHPRDATIESTGDLLLLFEGEENARNWFMEFKSNVDGTIIQKRYGDLHDRVRDALKAAGIITV